LYLRVRRRTAQTDFLEATLRHCRLRFAKQAL